MKCKHGIETVEGICGLCRIEDEGLLHRALEENKRALLNPWIIEAERFNAGDTTIRLNIVDSQTGEIRQIDLSVDDLSAIMYAGMERIHALAAIVNGDDISLLDKVLRIYPKERPDV